jgi:hypothetical protein
VDRNDAVASIDVLRSQRDRRGRRYVRVVLSVVRIGLVVLVVAWLLGLDALRSTVPIWLAFAIALGLELHFFVGALRPPRQRRPERGPQEVDRERYGYAAEPEDLLIVRDGGEELWIPYSDETDDVDALIAEAREHEDEPEATGPAGPWLPLRRLLAGLAVIGALALVLWFVDSRTGWDSLDAEARAAALTRFSEEASRIAAKPVSIYCDESGDYVGAVQHADGVAAVGGDLAYLTPERCLDLYRLAFEGDVTPSQTARAIAVLAHEAWHLRGERDEGTTECYALQSGVALGERLGLPESTARQLMRQQLAENSGAAPEYVVPAECRDGGRLDLSPDSAAFP